VHGNFPFDAKPPLAGPARRAIAALDALFEVEDPYERALSIVQVQTAVAARHAPFMELRRQLVVAYRQQKVSYRQIAALLGVSLGAVQNMERGHAGSWGTKPRRKGRASE
jgi:DNA-directed RNA polymerase specialized sigma24 family protein